VPPPPPPAPPSAIDTILAASDTLELHPDSSLALSDIVERAIRTSPITAAAMGNERIAKSTRRIAYGEYLPTLLGEAYALHNGLPASTAIQSPSIVSGSSPSLASTTTASSSLNAVPNTIAGNFGSRAAPTAMSMAAMSTPSATTLATIASPTTAGSGSGAFFDGFAQATAGWDLFTWGRREAEVRYGQEQVRAALAGRRDQEYVVRAQVKTTFFNLLRDEDLEAVGRVEVIRAENDLRAAIHRHDVGTATPADVLLFEYNLSTARLALIQAQINRRSDAYALGRLAGMSEAIDGIRTERSYDPTPLALPDSAIVSLALRQAPTLVAAHDSARAASAGVTAARTQYAPTLQVDGSYAWFSQAATIGSSRPGWALDLGTSYPIFNGFVREDAIERAAAARYVAQVTERDAERNTRALAVALLGAVGLAVEQVKIAASNLVVTREDYRVVQSRYSVGAATVLDLSVAEQNLATAEQQDVNARYNYQLARANLQTLVGEEI
jgi:outer membrane protein